MRERKTNNSRFSITSARGFHVRFKNGYTISTQFGGGNYCNNYNDEGLRPTKDKHSSNAEIAIIDNEGEFVTKRAVCDVTGAKDYDDNVLGWVDIQDWKLYLDWTEKQ